MKTQNDVKIFLEENKDLPYTEKHLKWLSENEAVRIKTINGVQEVFVIPDKKDTLDEDRFGVESYSFQNYKFFQDLWDDYITSLAKKEYAEKMRLAELEKQSTPSDNLDSFVKEATANF